MMFGTHVPALGTNIVCISYGFRVKTRPQYFVFGKTKRDEGSG